MDSCGQRLGRVGPLPVYLHLVTIVSFFAHDLVNHGANDRKGIRHQVDLASLGNLPQGAQPMRSVGCVSPLRFTHGDGLGFNAGLVLVLLGKSVRSREHIVK